MKNSGRSRDLVVQVEEFVLDVSQPDALVPLRRAEVFGVPERPQHACGMPARRDGQHLHPVGLGFVARVEHERLEQPRSKVGSSAQQFVVDAYRRGDAAQAARFRLLEAQQANHVRRVAMERDVLRRHVLAHVPIALVRAGVPHMAEQVAFAVLRARQAEVLSEAPEESRGFLDGPLVDRDTGHDLQTAPVGHFAPPRRDSRRQCKQREIGHCHARQRQFPRLPIRHRPSYLRDLVRAEPHAPRRILEVATLPRRRGGNRRDGRARVRAIEIPQRLLQEREVGGFTQGGVLVGGRLEANQIRTRR